HHVAEPMERPPGAERGHRGLGRVLVRGADRLQLVLGQRLQGGDVGVGPPAAAALGHGRSHDSNSDLVSHVDPPGVASELTIPPTMDYGINLATSADSWKVVKRAEELGYVRAWFYDTQLLNADMFVAMAAAAMQTAKIRLATGVLIPSNRIAPVAASALASLNALAAGRIDFGISTGFTARRSMGLGPVKLADMKEYIRIVQGLLAGTTLEWTFEDRRRKIRLLSPETGVYNVADPIPLHISALGPRGRRLTAELNAGWIYATGNVALARAAIADMQSAWREAGVDPASRVATAFTGGCVLEDGEAYDSPRVKA